MGSEDISADFPFESHYLEVHGANMHYIDEGAGDPILLLHGNPTSSDLWRNIIPHLTPYGRCIAPDLMGMGKSDKPRCAYRFFDHARYLEGFIQALGLKKITLVMHDWGAGLGFYYAHRNAANIRALAFMEAIYRPLHWSDFPLDFKLGFRLMRMPWLGWLMVSVMNVFVKQILPKATVRDLGAEERRRYAAPFPTIASRRPVRRWPCEIPIDGRPHDVHVAVDAYHLWLQDTELPKLLCHASPGGLISAAEVDWCKTHLQNLTVVDIGEGIHYLQEDHPHVIGKAVATWYTKLEA